MTISTDLDPNGGKTPLLPFESSSWNTAGIRVLPAQLARLLGVSKQAVSDWVKSGRIVLGVDGRVDPTAAMERLLKTGDPARLRAKTLRPMVEELNRYRARIVDLEAALGRFRDRIGEMGERIEALEYDLECANKEIEIEEDCASGYSDVFNALSAQLPDSWPTLSTIPENGGAAIIIGWLDKALALGVGSAGDLLGALDAVGEGEGGAL